ncbi:unnamed protein product [Cyclocybe aegerita]|uniref:DNA topoisomerase (ATP-hydrolyzing) n=1 Tax=Cyclocybe aegerita TaxID=1973307 RepID=A0A8S0W7U6_CYCAE|nr:unnamed protein product [Cyclocybe aegerita]
MDTFSDSGASDFDIFMDDADDELPSPPPPDGVDDFIDEDLDAMDEESDWDDTSMHLDDSDEPPAVVGCIEDLVLSFLTQLANPGCLRDKGDDSDCSTSNNKRSKADYRIELHLADRTKIDQDGNQSTKTLKYPRKCKTGSAKAFAQLFRVLDLAHEATLSGVPATKRDIYYKDVGLFKTQRVVDGLVDDLAATFELERSDLNIRSSSKGLVCGSGFAISLLSGDTISCNDTEGALIPAGEDIETFSVEEDVQWVLVVEKEAVFQTLCRLRTSQHELMPGRGIVITGKGYPDVATRHLVKSLANALPSTIPILGLVDGDPYGLDILSVYKYGSKGMQHENDKLAARRIKWVGILASELASLGIDKGCLLPITVHDEKKAISMLRRTDTPLPGRWKKELQHMLHTRRKAEIEILTSVQSEEKMAVSVLTSDSTFNGDAACEENDVSAANVHEDNQDLLLFDDEDLLSPTCSAYPTQCTISIPQFGDGNPCAPYAQLFSFFTGSPNADLQGCHVVNAAHSRKDETTAKEIEEFLTKFCFDGLEPFKLDGVANGILLEGSYHRHWDVYGTICFVPPLEQLQKIKGVLQSANRGWQNRTDYERKSVPRQLSKGDFGVISWQALVLHPQALLPYNQPLPILTNPPLVHSGQTPASSGRVWKIVLLLYMSLCVRPKKVISILAMLINAQSKIDHACNTPGYPRTAIVEQYHKILTATLSEIFFEPTVPPQLAAYDQRSAQDIGIEANTPSGRGSGQASTSTSPDVTALASQTLSIHDDIDDIAHPEQEDEDDEDDLTESEVGQMISKLRDPRTGAKDMSALVQLLARGKRPYESPEPPGIDYL